MSESGYIGQNHTGKERYSVISPTMEQAAEQNYDDILRYFVYRVGRNDAEDLTQETFFRFLRYSDDPANRFRTAQKCRAYLFAIASNVCRDYFSKRTAEETDEIDENLSVPDETDGRDLSAVIEAALSKLPDAQREAAVLYYYSGFRVREIAAIQNVSVTAVKSRLKTARDSLKIILGEEGFS